MNFFFLVGAKELLCLLGGVAYLFPGGKFLVSKCDVAEMH